MRGTSISLMGRGVMELEPQDYERIEKIAEKIKDCTKKAVLIAKGHKEGEGLIELHQCLVEADEWARDLKSFLIFLRRRKLED